MIDFSTFKRDVASYVARVTKGSNTDRDLDGLADVAGPQPKISGGWEARSGSSPFTPYMVFEVGGIADAAAFRAWALGEGHAFKSLLGCYKGNKNPSFIMEDTSANRLAIAYWVRKQESILCLGPAYRPNEQGLHQLFGNRVAILDYLQPDGYQVFEREPLPGRWQAVSKATALKLDNWTFDPSENQYYAVV